MNESSEREIQQAVHTLSESDPLSKLLREVKLGRMKPTDAGLRAMTDAWLNTYRDVLEKADVLDLQALRRLDPSPRLDMLAENGMITQDDAVVVELRTVYQQALANRLKSPV